MTRGDSRGVCHVVYARYPADPRVRKEVETLARQGNHITVLSLRSAGEPETSESTNVRVFRFPLVAIRGSRTRYAFQYLLFFLLVFSRLSLIHSRAYRVVHVHSLPDFLVFAAIGCRLFGASLILDLHESMPELYLARFAAREGSFIHRLALAAQRLSCLAADHIITVNPAIRNLLVQRGVPPSRITIVENAPDWGQPGVQSPLPQNSGGHTIVIVGGLNQERDLDIVIRAAVKVRASTDVRWRIIGYGDVSYRRHLEALTRELGVDGELTIEPEVPAGDVRDLLSESSIGIVSYQRNPLTEIATPNKAYEYAALGKATIVADLPALRDLLGEAVAYYEPGNAESLAAGISLLLGNESLRKELGHRIALVHREHSWEVMAHRLETIYNRLVTKSRRKSSGA